MNRTFTSALACLLASLLPAPGEIQTETLTYSDGDTDLIGYLAVDTGGSKTKPGAIVVHEWWGHDAYAQKRARMLAEQGYAALTLDMYGEADRLIPMEKVEAFKKEMEGAGADYTVKIYPGAMHSFRNPDADRFGAPFEIPLGYNEAADTASWADTLSFFAASLRAE